MGSRGPAAVTDTFSVLSVVAVTPLGTSVKFLSDFTVNVDAFHCVRFTLSGKPEQENSTGTRLTLSTVAGPRPNSTKPSADTTAGSRLLCATGLRSIRQLGSTRSERFLGLGSGAPVGALRSFWGWGTAAMPYDNTTATAYALKWLRGKSHVSFTTIKVSASLVQL